MQEALQADLVQLRERHEREVAAWSKQVAELKEQLESNVGVSFFDDRERQQLTRKYEHKLQSLKRAHDQEISSLLQQFQREKQSAMEILKARIKSEINMIIPRIRDQIKENYAASTRRAQADAAKAAERKYEGIIISLREEHRLDKQHALRQLQERYERDRSAWQAKVKNHYEMRLMQVKNEAERRILARLHR